MLNYTNIILNKEFFRTLCFVSTLGVFSLGKDKNSKLKENIQGSQKFFNLQRVGASMSLYSISSILIYFPKPVFQNCTSKAELKKGIKNICKWAYVVFWPCQQNLIKTFQNEANTPLITKIALKNFLNIFGPSY